jgi:hypothetical protein
VGQRLMMAYPRRQGSGKSVKIPGEAIETAVASVSIHVRLE